MSRMKKLISVLLAVALTVACASSFACTGFYVGKQASANGTTIIGHTVDASTTSQTVINVIERVENEPGRIFSEGWGDFSWPLPDTTYAYTATPFSGGICHNGVANEMGVAISAAVTCYISDEISAMDPVVDDGLSEGFLCALVGACCATAREGVDLLAKVIEEIGNSEQNTIFIADQNEAWYMETYTGHQWCAVRMPEDCVAVFGNQFMLGAVDPESEDVLYSEGLFTMPEEAGLAVYTEDGLMDLFATYSGNALANASNRRTWYGHFMLAPSTAGDYGTKTRYDLFYQPDEKVTLDEVFEVTRARFEGTQWCPETTGRMDQRVIGTEKQANVNAIEVYDDLPAAMSCVTWTCMANAEHSVYLPVSNLVTDVAESYKYEPARENMWGGVYDPKMAHVVFKRLCALSEQDRTYYGQGVRDYWHSVELELVESYPQVLAQTQQMYQTDPAAAAEYITDYTIALQEKAFDEANLMYDELTWYMIANTNAQKYSYDSSTMTMGDTLNWTPFTPSLALEEQAG
ncbi:MAG: C69 family dipeptidase [Clostridia bacterium]|nr:C69 family dipeptidase [Clostridia bacterium]